MNKPATKTPSSLPARVHALQNNPKITKIKIQTSFREDSATALFLLLETEEGSKRFPDIKDAEVEIWETGATCPNDRTWRDYLAEGTLLIGIGGSPLDEHVSEEFGDGKAEGLSATKIVARVLGIHKHPLYHDLVNMVTKNDREETERTDTISVRMKAMHRTNIPPGEILGWVYIGIRAEIAKQKRHLDAINTFRERGKDRPIERNGTTIRMCFVESDNYCMSGAVRTLHPDTAILVQKRSSGNVQVLVSSKFVHFDMDKVAACIRKAELIAYMREDLVPEKWEDLSTAGTVADVPNWYYAKGNGSFIVNGSETAPAVTPTRIPIKTLLNIVYDNVDFKPKAKSDKPQPQD